MRESESEKAPISCINHVAVMSWAETKVPNNRRASQKAKHRISKCKPGRSRFIHRERHEREAVALLDRINNCDLHGKVMVKEGQGGPFDSGQCGRPKKPPRSESSVARRPWSTGFRVGDLGPLSMRSWLTKATNSWRQ